MDKATFRHWILALAERHGRELTPTVIRLYFEVVRDMPQEEFEAACASLFMHGERFPSPADIFAAAPGYAADQAMEHRRFAKLWERVTGYWEPTTTFEQKARRIEEGYGRAALAAFQATGGWDRWLTVFRAGDERQHEWLRRDFLLAYRQQEQASEGATLAARPGVQALVEGSRKVLDGASARPELHRIEQALLGAGI